MTRTIDSYVERITIVKNPDGTIKEIMSFEIDTVMEDGKQIRASYGDLKSLSTGTLETKQVIEGINADALQTIAIERSEKLALQNELQVERAKNNVDNTKQ